MIEKDKAVALVAVCILVAAIAVYRWVQRDRSAPSGSGNVPDWASFFTVDEYRQFNGLVEDCFRQRGRPFRVEDGLVYSTGENGEPVQSGLQNVAQVCHQEEDLSAWPEIISSYFGMENRMRDEREQLEIDKGDFAKVANLLAVRLWPADVPQPVKDNGIYREDIPGTISTLVFDLPTTVRSASAKDVESWGITKEELFKRALANVAERLAPVESEEINLQDGLRLRVLAGESHFVATHALLLTQHPECVGGHGSLISIPNRHVLLCYPIQDLTVIKVLPVFKGLTHNRFTEGPGSISPDIYWYSNGAFTLLPLDIDGKSINFKPPDNFLDMLNTLPETQPAESRPTTRQSD